MTVTRAFVVHPEIDRDAFARLSQSRLEEAVALARALPEIEVAGAEIVRLASPVPGWLFGSGKRAELHDLFKELEVELVLIDGPVTPVQQRNLEKAWDVKLLDRTGLILEIFSDRAATREGVLQVEMAALAYQRTRLVRAWTHLERQRGGLGFVGGPGETQIEADRRAIDGAMVRLKRKLEKVRKTRSLHRQAREKVPYPVVALVGYTNAGKSTLFNRLSGASVLEQDMLFATLDPTMRAVRVAGAGDVILSDTVGFVSDLPTELVAAFRATLEEVLAADVLVHVRDIAHPDTDAQAQDVDEILQSLGVAEDTRRIEVWNKLDLLNSEELAAAEARANRRDDVVMISAHSGIGLDQLGTAIGDAVEPELEALEVTLNWSEGRARAYLFDVALVDHEAQTDEGYVLQVRLSPRQKKRLETLRIVDPA